MKNLSYLLILMCLALSGCASDPGTIDRPNETKPYEAEGIGPFDMIKKVSITCQQGIVEKNRSQNFESRHWDHKLPAPFPNPSHLLHDLCL